MDGNGPVGGLTYAGQSSGLPYDGISPLFGVTGGGVANNGGTVFELTNSGATWVETVLYNFCSQGIRNCRDGKSPNSALIMDSEGNLFGTALYGGNDIQAGTAFELSPTRNAWRYTLLYTFCSASNCADGANPSGPLLFDQENNLLGTTYAGATCRRSRSHCGTIFKIIPNGAQSQESVLHTFCQLLDCKDGAGPVGGVVADAAGTLFGVTTIGGGHDIDQGGNGGGTVFELTDSGLTVLHRFCALANCADGEHPLAGVVLDQAGQVYGTTGYGGEFEKVYGGTIFQVKPPL
jgi:hypothetical protein